NNSARGTDSGIQNGTFTQSGLVSAFLTMSNTIVASNGGSTDFRGPFTSNGNNLIGNVTDGGQNSLLSTDLGGVDPLLGPLQNNGGLTKTMALTPRSVRGVGGSPAIDAGANVSFSTDQRGSSRNVGQGVDIGAYESQLVMSPSFVVNTTAEFT